MGVYYSNIFTATDAIDHEIFTVLLETISPIGGEPFFVIKTLTGEYKTREDFQDAREYIIKGWEKGYTDKGELELPSSLSMLTPGTRKLLGALKEALEASEES